jgi:hypothetical protein
MRNCATDGMGKEFFFEGLVARCHSFYLFLFGGTLPLFLFIFKLIEQTYNIFIHTTRRAPLLLSSLLSAR